MMTQLTLNSLSAPITRRDFSPPAPPPQRLQQKIQTTLQMAQGLPPEACLRTIKTRLLAIQADCRAIAKTFIFVEASITCDQYNLGGCAHDQATLFRGPNEDASVAICVTAQGSLLHRDGGAWQVYYNAGDVHPEGLNL
jgi:hypothetical protein